MNALSDHSDLLQAMLDGTLDAAGEQTALDLLATDAEARSEFARLAQLHAWLSTDDSTRSLLTETVPVPVALPAHRKVIPHPVWWLAAAVAAAIILLTASKLWPMAGAPVPLAYREPPRPVLQAACTSCHASVEGLPLPPVSPLR